MIDTNHPHYPSETGATGRPTARRAVPRGGHRRPSRSAVARGSRAATWRVLRWDDRPAVQGTVSLTCDCGHDAECPVAGDLGGHVIAVIGMGVVFDPPSFIPPSNFMPNEVACRKCGRVYNDTEVDHVR